MARKRSVYVWPSAHIIAVAAVAACKVTHEDVWGMMSGAFHSQARHYALHALAAELPDAPRRELATKLGAKGSPEKFWDNSAYNIGNPSRDMGTVKAPWFTAWGFENVRRAIRDALNLEAAAKPPPEAMSIIPPSKEEEKIDMAVPTRKNPRAPLVAPRFSTVSDVGLGYEKRRRSEDLLREAILNTGGRLT